MPGFNFDGTASERQKNYVAEPRRKHRWIVSALQSGEGQTILEPGELIYLQKAARPNFKYDAKEMHHDQEEAWFAGKQHWETMEWVFYDIQWPVDISEKIRGWFQTVTTNFNNPERETAVAMPRAYKGTATIDYYGGGGTKNETWRLIGAWPENCNWGDLDYTTSDLQLITATIRYDRAVGKKLGNGEG